MKIRWRLGNNCVQIALGLPCRQQTPDRVLVHVDTEHVGEKLVNRLALSRGCCDAQVYTNDKGALDRAGVVRCHIEPQYNRLLDVAL